MVRHIFTILIALTLCLSLTVPAYGQYREYYIYGKVVDTEKQPLAKVTITIRDINTSRSYGTKSNKKGEFKLAGLPHGVYQVTMTKEGYETRTDEWRFETPQNRMQKVEVKTAVMISKEKLKQIKRSKKLEGLFKQATELIRKRDLDGAIKVLEKMLGEKADDTNALYLLGICYLNKKELPKAIDILTGVIKQKPDFAGAYTQLGVAHQRNGDSEKALENYKKVLEFDAKNMIGIYNSGIILYGQQKAADAVGYFEKALALNPGSADILEMAGLCYLQTEKYEKALEYLGKALAAAKDPEKKKSLDELVKDLKKQLNK
jgi:tetratricopeptide (TPR) repeat protein